MTIACPICKKPVEAGAAGFPFCSDRCRLLDLGNWASEKYVVSTPAQPFLPDDEPAEDER